MTDSREKADYTIQELMDEAKVHGSPIAKRMIHEWVYIGLLAGPTRKGLGKGQGTVATWPDNQRQLLLLLLDKRKNDTKEIGKLCNIPVWLWLEWGDSYAPLSQVKKALTTWRKKYYPTRSSIKARRAAELLVAQLDRINGREVRKSDREKLIKTVVDSSFRREFDGLSIKEEIKKAYNLEDTGTARSSVDDFVSVIKARVFAIKNLEDFSDDEFERVRLTYKNFLQTPPELLTDPKTGEIYQNREDDMQERVGTACITLITALGIQSLGMQGRTEDSPEESNL